MIETIFLEETSPKKFFTDYIRTRLPVKFSNQITNVRDKWTNSYLSEIAGDSMVKVEYRNDPIDRFGKGKEKKMKFSEFLSELSNGSELLYLTTQNLTYSPEGQPDITSSPITELLKDIPIRPEIMGNLIPQNINLWMGQSSRPTTSGLHHDFHDNLYIVLRGKKTITLFSPSEAENLYTVGKISLIHKNGRINYEGQLTMADGSDCNSGKALKASLELESAIAKLEQNVILIIEVIK
jgi:hypothetical protein